MQLRSTIPFLIAVFIVAVAGVMLALRISGEDAPENSADVPRIITVAVVVTATPDPNYTPPVVIVTATPGGPGQVQLSDSLDLENDTSPGSGIVAATIDPAIIGADGQSSDELVALPANCLRHVVASGDTPYAVAEAYGANPFLMMDVNGLTEDNSVLLQIGDVLLVPLEGCPLDQLPASQLPFVEPAEETEEPAATETPTEEPDETAEARETPNVTPSPRPSPTITLAPTAVDAQIEIVDVLAVGDVTEEGVRIRNLGRTVNVTGWTLTDSDDNEFTFPEQLVFSNAEVTIYTRSGQNTPVALFWDLDEPVWEPGDVLTLLDGDGKVQATLRIASSGSRQ